MRYNNYRTFYNVSFTDVFPDEETFLAEYQGNKLPKKITDGEATTLYYLLYARYGNDIVASNDLERFKYQLFATVFMYAPTWAKRLELQDKLRALTEDELLRGTTQIHNMATNAGTPPSTQTIDELEAINTQNVVKYKKDKLTAYTSLNELLKTDVTKEFLDRFSKLFLLVVQGDHETLYEEIDEEDLEI